MGTRIVVVGGGRVGAELARLLLDGGHEVMVLDDRPHVVERVHAQLGPGVVTQGDVTDPAALERAGVRGADVLAAATAADERNLVVACLARYHFGVPRTVARIVDPARGWMYTSAMGVDVAINQADIIARMAVEEMSSLGG